MAVLKCKTRGGTSPHGKPRVWFCAHPGDYKAYLEPIAQEILSVQSCAVYYDGEPEAPFDGETFLSDLSRMNLFVMPVTARLLAGESRAIAVEFRYAMEHHIPVLPLMQEEGLEALFNNICGDLQFLDKNARDRTAIPYGEKLRRYLSSVLVGDELAQRVRDAFDAYIFLSYRKKDRKHANELMRLIHQNDFCRDIAIWYDEFLTPGESFNESIAKAIEKSSLFALAVTPNLINEKNYVMTEEYPAARRAKKRILPAELVKTGHGKLKRKYKGIPACVDARDGAALSDALKNALGSIALRENDGDPRHNFFIGLAYLGGIDVEVDHTRALTLIEGAANDGLPDAMEKLVSMHQIGEGVARDYEKAAEWQKTLVTHRKSVYGQTGDPDDAFSYLLALWDLGEYLYDMQRLSDAKAAYGEMNAEATRLADAADYPWAWKGASVSGGALGDIAKADGRLDTARYFYERDLTIREALARKLETAEARRDLSIGYDRMGNLAEAEGKLREARAYFEKSTSLREAVALDTEEIGARQDLSVSYQKLGGIAQKEGKLDEAREYYQKDLAICEELASKTGTVETRRSLSVCYHKLGGLSLEEGRLSEAREYFEKDREICEAIALETETVGARRDLSVSYERLGAVAEEEGRLDEAREYYQKDLAICEELARETGTVQARRDLSVCYDKLGRIAGEEGRLDEAREYFQKDLAICEELAHEMGTAEMRRGLSVSYSHLGNVAEAEGRHGEARELYAKSLTILEALALEVETVEARSDLAIGYIKLGNVAKAEEAFGEAREYYRKSLTIREGLAAELGTAEARRDLSLSCNRLGDLARTEKQTEEAREYYRRGLALREVLAKETDSVRAWDELAISHYKLASVSEGAEKESALREALRILDGLIERCPENGKFVRRRDNVRKKLGEV